MIAAGQAHGAIAQGVGQALLEHAVYDPRVGPAARRLVHGLRAAARRRPAVVRPGLQRHALHDQSARREGLRRGRRGRGFPAIANAIVDALAPLGVTQFDGPATPFRVWQAMRAIRP